MARNTPQWDGARRCGSPRRGWRRIGLKSIWCLGTSQQIQLTIVFEEQHSFFWLILCRPTGGVVRAAFRRPAPSFRRRLVRTYKFGRSRIVIEPSVEQLRGVRPASRCGLASLGSPCSAAGRYARQLLDVGRAGVAEPNFFRLSVAGLRSPPFSSTETDIVWEKSGSPSGVENKREAQFRGGSTGRADPA